MNKKSVVLLAFLILTTLPIAAFALDLPTFPGDLQRIDSLWVVVVNILKFIWPIFIGVAILMFIVSGFLFLTGMGDPGKTGLARQSLIWGIIGVIIALLAFSLPFMIINLLGGDQGGAQPPAQCQAWPFGVNCACTSNEDCQSGSCLNGFCSPAQPASGACEYQARRIGSTGDGIDIHCLPNKTQSDCETSSVNNGFSPGAFCGPNTQCETCLDFSVWCAGNCP